MKKIMYLCLSVILLVLCCSCSDSDETQTISTNFVSESPHHADVQQPSEEMIINEVSVTPKIPSSQCYAKAKTFTYTGHSFIPKVNVIYHNQRLTKNKDYTVTLDDTVQKIGIYTAKINMTGDFEGDLFVNYSVLPPVPEFTETSSTISALSVSWENLSDIVDGYELSYSTDSTFPDDNTTVLKTAETTFSLDELPQNSVYYFKIRTFKTVNGAKLFSDTGHTLEVPLKKIEVIDGITYIDGVLIVNKTYGLPENFGNGLDSNAVSAFETMAHDALNDGIYLYIISGYRSYWTQDNTYHYFLNLKGFEQAERISAHAGHSEHQTGLAMDINSTAFAFNDTPEAKWLAENCSRYGFVIRYPKDKESVTGYAYESWHIRYLGEELAQYLTENHLTLEEYFGITSQYAE